jgi:Lhr-like helicase
VLPFDLVISYNGISSYQVAVNKQAAQKFEGERFNLRKLNELEVMKQYQIEITNRFAALENLDNDGDINWAGENIKENIQTSERVLVYTNRSSMNHGLMKNV